MNLEGTRPLAKEDVLWEHSRLQTRGHKRQPTRGEPFGWILNSHSFAQGSPNLDGIAGILPSGGPVKGHNLSKVTQ